MSKIVYISIGNSDNKLTQEEWANFQNDVHYIINDSVNYADSVIHGRWVSLPTDPWQNACWCVEYKHEGLSQKSRIANCARKYRQDSVSWAEAPETEFI